MKLLGFAVGSLAGTAVFLGVGCALAAIHPVLVPIAVVGAAMTRDF